MLLAVLVMVAMPVQGLAAISAGTCMALGHHDALAAAMNGPDAAHDAYAVAAASGHVDEGAVDGAEGAHCGPCVAGCAAAAILVASSIFQPDSLPGDRVAFAAAAPPEYLPELLDRPPLTFSA